MPQSTCREQAAFISAVLILWAFQLTLNPAHPLDDMGFMISEKAHRPCTIEFKMRIPETELSIL